MHFLSYFSQNSNNDIIPQGWTDKTLMKTLDAENCLNAGPPDELDESPYKKYTKPHISEIAPPLIPSQCCASCFCDCKAKYNLYHPPPQKPLIHRECRKENVPGGGGAAGIDSNLASPTKDRNKCQQQSKGRQCMITGGVELVPLLARRRAQQRPISLSTTDVTKYPNDNKKFVM